MEKYKKNKKGEKNYYEYDFFHTMSEVLEYGSEKIESIESINQTFFSC